MAEQSSRRTRVPLTKAQLQTAAGVELLALCQTVTEDGSISDGDISELRAWLERNRTSDLPSVSFLTATVQKIIADGKVDEWERRELHKALERVLPADLRSRAVAAREEAERREYGNDARGDVRDGDRYDFMVAGVHYEGRGAVIQEHVAVNDPAFLFRDRTNRFSRNAIEVRTSGGFCIGYVPEEFATDLAPLLDKGARYHAWFKKVLTGGRVPIPVVIADVFEDSGEVAGALPEGQLPSRTAVTMSSAAFLDASTPDDVLAVGPVLDRFIGLMKADLECLNHQRVNLDTLGQFVSEYAKVFRSVRAFFARNPLAAPYEEVTVRETTKILQSVALQVRAAVEQLRANGGSDEAARASAVIAALDSVVATFDSSAQPQLAAQSAASVVPCATPRLPIQSAERKAFPTGAIFALLGIAAALIAVFVMLAK